MVNATLMAEVAGVIKIEGRHDQTSWVALIDPGDRGEELTVIRGEEILDWAYHPVSQLGSYQLHVDPVCGSKACFAGWAAILHAGPQARYVLRNGGISMWPDGTPQSEITVQAYAMKALEIEQDVAGWLFDPYRSTEQILFSLDFLPAHPDADLSALIDHWLHRKHPQIDELEELL